MTIYVTAPMSTERRPPEPLGAGYCRPVSRRLRAGWRRLRWLLRAYRRTFPLAPDDMRLAYGDRQALLLGVVLLGLAGLGARLFATELFRSQVSRDLLLVVGFNVGLTAAAGAGTLGYRRVRAVVRACRRRLAAPPTDQPRKL